MKSTKSELKLKGFLRFRISDMKSVILVVVKVTDFVDVFTVAVAPGPSAINLKPH